MPAKKPQSLNRRHDTNADKQTRASGEAALRPLTALPKAPPARLDGHDVARSAWRRLLKLYGELEAEIVTRLDLDMLTDYCLLLEQTAELDSMRQVAYRLWLELAGKHDELAKAGVSDAAVEMATRVVGAFDAIVKLDGRVDRKRALMHQWRQSLYLTPRTRAGVAPNQKTPPEPEDELERMLRGVDLGPVVNEQLADRAVRFFENLRHTKGRFFGQPFKLLGWQTPIVRNVYGTLTPAGYRQYKYVWVEIPKKNGKSEICAGAGLYHTFADGERNGEVYGCAAEKQQASIVFDVAVDMIDQAPALKKRTKLNLSQKKLTDKVSGTFYKVVSAEAYSKHGLNPSAVIFDELHAQPNRDLWDVMTFGAGDARTQPIWWIITTAGNDPDRVSIAWEQHEYAERILAGDIVDPTWYPVIYSYPGEDIYNESNWQQANPSLGETITLESVRQAADKAKVKPADERLFRWLRLNQWVTTKLTSWLPLDLFDNSVGKWDRAGLLGHECYLGLDLSTTTDLSGLCAIFPPQADQPDWRVIWEAWIPKVGMQERILKDHVPYDQWAAAGWVAPTEGDWIDYDLIEEKIKAFAALYNIKELAYDPAFAVGTIQHLMKVGIECMPIKQHYEVLTDPMNKLEVMLGQGQMTHEDNRVARWCFGNTSIAKNGNSQIKYVKETRGRGVVATKRIDLLAAWVIGLVRALTYENSTSVYETRGLTLL